MKIKLLDYIDKCKLHIIHNKALTGHTHYGSPYESYDNCGTCDGAKCDYCKELNEFHLYDIEMNKHNFMEMIRKEVSDAGNYLPDYSTLEKWHNTFEKFIESVDITEEHHNIKFDFLKLEVIIELFTIHDIEKYKNYLFDVVYCIQQKNCPGTLYTTSKDFAKKLIKILGDAFYMYAVYKYNLEGDETFIKEEDNI